MTSTVRRVLTDDDGQDLVEYALLAALVALVTVAGWDAIEGAIGVVYARSGVDSASTHDSGLWQLFGGPSR